MPKQTYYDILGVSRTATEGEIKQSYRTLAREYHPDVNSSPDAEDMFKEINLAYATLTDSLKRADYDQSLNDSGVRRDPGYAPSGQSAYADAPAGEAAPDAYASPYRQAMIRAAYARTVVFALMAGIVGAVIRVGLAVISEQEITPPLILGGMLPGAIIGGLIAADINFKVETFLGTGWLGRSFTFARTILMSLGLGYFFGLIGGSIDRAIGPEAHFVAPVLILIGILTGAVFGSDGDTMEKIRSGSGRFNLLYTFIRGAQVGVVGGLIGAALGAILAEAGIGGVFAWSVFVGFSLGMIIGSIKPPNLAAYASYASASVKNVMFMIMLLLALISGVGVGALFQTELSGFFRVG